MKAIKKQKDDISAYLKDQEYIANVYVMRCTTITMLVYSLTFLLNLAGVFAINKKLMLMGFAPCMVIYAVVAVVYHTISLSDKRMKYFMLTANAFIFTIAGVSITYHVTLVPILNLLYATLYSSKKMLLNIRTIPYTDSLIPYLETSHNPAYPLS